jgi:hypothetical protein
LVLSTLRQHRTLRARTPRGGPTSSFGLGLSTCALGHLAHPHSRAWVRSTTVVGVKRGLLGVSPPCTLAASPNEFVEVAICAAKGVSQEPTGRQDRVENVVVRLVMDGAPWWGLVHEIDCRGRELAEDAVLGHDLSVALYYWTH